MHHVNSHKHDSWEELLLYILHTCQRYTCSGMSSCYRRLRSNAEGTADTTRSFKWARADGQGHNGTARENTWLLKETAYFYDKSSLLVMWLHSSWRDSVISWASESPRPLKRHLHTAMKSSGPHCAATLGWVYDVIGWNSEALRFVVGVEICG